jgi:hypothetical protein
MPTYQGSIAATAGAVATGGSWSKSSLVGHGLVGSSGTHGVGAKGYTAASQPSTAGAGVTTGRPIKSWPGHPGIASTRALGGIVIPVITDAQFDEAERRPERWPAWSLQVDWTDEDFTGIASDLSDTIRSVEVERSITGELPDESGVVDGYATGTLTAQLGGRRDGAELTFAEELSPYRPDSPLYGKTLVTPTARFELGLLTDAGEKTYRQLTGPIRSLRMGEADESVQLQAVDPSERIREVITLPTYAEFVTHAVRRPWALTINTQWVVDFVLRQNSIYASPPPREDAIISCTGHGGLASEIGFNGAPISIYGTGPQSGLWTEDNHPFGMLGTPENSTGGTVGYQEFYGITDGYNAPFQFAAGYGVGVSCWLHIGSYMNLGASFENRILQIRPGDIVSDNDDNQYPRLFLSGFGNGDIYAGLSTSANNVYSTPHIPTGRTPSWRFVGLHFRMASATSLVITVRVDQVTRTYTLAIPSTTPAHGYRPTLQVNGQMFRGWTNLQAWVKYDAPSLAEWQAGEYFTPQADIARGNNELLYLPDVAAADSWEVLKAAVQAEFGVHGFTPDGRYFFRPRTDSRSEAVDVDIDVETNLSDVAYTISSDSIRNVIGYTSTPKYHSGDWQTVVQAQDALQFVCPPGISKFELDWPWGAAGRQGGTVPYYFDDQTTTPNPLPQWTGDIPHGWTYSYGTNWTGEVNNYIVVVTYCQTGPRKMLLTVNNTSSSTTVRLGSDANVANLAGEPGDPALHIGGWPMITLPDHVEEYRNEASIAKYRSPRALSLNTSDWRQTPGVLDSVAQELLAAMAEPVSVLEDLPVRGNPRTQVGMVARLHFRGESTPVIGIVVKTHRTLDSNGINDQISVRPLPVQALAPTGWSFYIDTSHYQWEQGTPIDLQRVANTGYAGHVAKIGQGGGTTDAGSVYGASIDPYWSTALSTSRGVPTWSETFAGYWYVGGTESPAAQASRCKAVLDTESRMLFPDDLPVDSVRSDGPYSLGTEFRVSASAQCTGLVFDRPSTAITGVTGQLWRANSATSGTAVSPVMTFPLSGTGKQRVYFSAPITLTPGQRYKVVINYPKSFPECLHYWDTGVGSAGVASGVLSAPRAADALGGAQCSWLAGGMAYPTRVSSNNPNWGGDVMITSTTPVMLDWEDGGGTWSNLLAVLAAFNSAGIAVTMLYTNLQGYAPSHGAATIDASTGLRLINSRYWISSTTDPAQNPRKVFDDILATNPTFGRGTVLGGSVDALQFTSAGVTYSGMAVDVNAAPVPPDVLSSLFYNRM